MAVFHALLLKNKKIMETLRINLQLSEGRLSYNQGLIINMMRKMQMGRQTDNFAWKHENTVALHL